MKNTLALVAVSMLSFVACGRKNNADSSTLGVNSQSVNKGIDVALGSEGAGCPKVMHFDQSFRSYEGGGETSGAALVDSFATKTEFASSDASSVTWKITLKPEFKKCTMGARPNDVLSLDIAGGVMLLKLDVSAHNQKFHNSLIAITSQSIKGLNPVYKYAIQD